MRTIYVRSVVIEPQRIDRCISCILIEMPRLDDRDLLPRSNWFWRDVRPGFSAIRRYMYEAIVSSHPDAVNILKGGRDRVNNASLSRLGRGLEFSDTGRNIPRLPGQIGTY